MMGRDGIAGLVMLVVSVFLYALTFRIHPNSLVPVSPAFYPRIVLGSTAVLSLAMLVVDLIAHRRAPRTEKPAQAAARPRYDMVAVLFAIFTVYVLVLPYLGFRISTLAFIAVMQGAMDFPRTPRRWVVVAIVAIATTAATYYMFE